MRARLGDAVRLAGPPFVPRLHQPRLRVLHAREVRRLAGARCPAVGPVAARPTPPVLRSVVRDPLAPEYRRPVALRRASVRHLAHVAEPIPLLPHELQPIRRVGDDGVEAVGVHLGHHADAIAQQYLTHRGAPSSPRGAGRSASVAASRRRPPRRSPAAASAPRTGSLASSSSIHDGNAEPLRDFTWTRNGLSLSPASSGPPYIPTLRRPSARATSSSIRFPRLRLLRPSLARASLYGLPQQEYVDSISPLASRVWLIGPACR